MVLLFLLEDQQLHLIQVFGMMWQALSKECIP